MELAVSLVFAAAVLFGADRLLLWLERRGHITWRRTRHTRPGLAEEPETGLETLLAAASGRAGGRE
ncbi:hypothetical protein HNP84_004779 [Thermocatellispora tengchongensis]|uniref:Uncharacterized protein n=1 Tax=Thermocatellispora tengchongensis TaxID=1073253 RepID=A0A840PAT3_9ACTN|nr:hypothetical protein [Thermocatellispora tengchongensis]MBB5135043.1 hypothetical protein [Thermocatellispora tengchongensis]